LPPWLGFGELGIGPGYESDFGVWLVGSNASEAELLQPVALPADATLLQLEFWWRAESQSNQYGDVVEVIAQYGDEQSEHFLTLSAVDPRWVWRQEVADLTDFAGQEVAITFLAHTNGWVPSTFRLDDITLWSCSQPSTLPVFLPLIVR
jgi:hypothetical protein